MLYHKILLKPVHLSLFCLASWLCFISPSVAQINSNSAPDSYQQNEYDPLSGSSGFNPLDLIHRANLGTSRNNQQFQTDSQENLDNAASEFKRQQQEQLQNQPVTEPSKSN